MKGGHNGQETFAMKSTATTRLARPLEVMRGPSASSQPAMNGNATLGWFDTLAARLGPNEFRRRLWHFAPGGLALMGAAIPNRGPVPASLLNTILCFSVVVATLAIYFQKSIRRPGEQTCLGSIFGYLISVLPLLIFFPEYPELALAVTGIIAFGDGSATLVGILWGSSKLPWNKAKSWAGTATFVLAAFPIVTLLYWGGSLTHVSLNDTVLCIGPTVVISALFESLPTRISDNILVGIGAAATLTGMHALVVGWA